MLASIALALLLAALPALGAPAQSPRTSHPLAHAARLRSSAPSLAAGRGLLADRAAVDWLLENRPAAAPGLIADAYRLQDLSELLESADDPAAIRTALLTRADGALSASPAAVAGLAARAPELAGKARLIAAALLELPALPSDAAALLTAQDAVEWPRLTLKSRWQRLRQLYGPKLSAGGPGRSGDESVDRRERALELGRWLMLPPERTEREKDLRRARALLEAATLIRETLDRPGAQPFEHALDLGAAEQAARVALVHSGKRAEAARLFDAEKPLEPEEVERLTAELRPRIGARLAEDVVGRELLGIAGRRGTGLEIAHTWAWASVDREATAVTLSHGLVRRVLRSLGRSPASLLASPDALDLAGAALANVVFHELVHVGQAERDPVAGPALLEKELEAYARQGGFVHRTTRVPALRALLDDVFGLDFLPSLRMDEAALRRDLMLSEYAMFPSLPLFNARRIEAAAMTAASAGADAARQALKSASLLGDGVADAFTDLSASLARATPPARD